MGVFYFTAFDVIVIVTLKLKFMIDSLVSSVVNSTSNIMEFQFVHIINTVTIQTHDTLTKHHPRHQGNKLSTKRALIATNKPNQSAWRAI